MGIFDRIKSAIRGDDAESSEARPVDTLGNLPNPTLTTGLATDVSTAANDPVMRDVAAAGVQPFNKPVEIQRAQDSAAMPPAVDIETNLDRAAANSGQDLNWRHSIVDLMKALGMDASLQERRELATELNYAGDHGDTASMNTFLHKALLRKLSENGGNVPRELID